MQAIAPLLLSLVITGPTSASRGASTLEVQECQVTAIRQIDIPARQLGVLKDIFVDEGMMVTEGQQVAQIDDEEARLRFTAAQREAEAAAEQARDDVDVQAAEKAAEVAREEVVEAKEINRRAPKVISRTELRRQELTAERAHLQTLVAKMEFDVATKTAAAKAALADVTRYDVESRKLIAPFAGLIIQRARQAGEWVQAGDPVLRLVQMDRLRVQGRLSAENYAPHEIEGRPVTITVQLPGGKTFEAKGRIGYVSQVVELADEYRVWAEIENVPADTRDNRVFWTMRPGMLASMVIDMTQQ